VMLIQAGAHRCKKGETSFIMEFYDRGKWSYLALVQPDACYYQSSTGADLMKLADLINELIGVQYCWLLDMSVKKVHCEEDAPVECPERKNLSLPMLSLLTTGRRWYSQFDFVPEDQNSRAVRQSLGMVRTLQKSRIATLFPDPRRKIRELLDPTGALTLQQALHKLKIDWSTSTTIPACDELGILIDLLNLLGNELRLVGIYMRKIYKGPAEQPKLVGEYPPVPLSDDIRSILDDSDVIP